jgi:hypothetical protein
MKSLTKLTLVITVAVTLWSTAAMAGEVSNLPVSSAAQSDRPSATTATSSVPLYAVSRLEAQTLADQAMTDQELKAVEGAASFQVFLFDVGWGTLVMEVHETSYGGVNKMYID